MLDKKVNLSGTMDERDGDTNGVDPSFPLYSRLSPETWAELLPTRKRTIRAFPAIVQVKSSWSLTGSYQLTIIVKQASERTSVG